MNLSVGDHTFLVRSAGYYNHTFSINVSSTGVVTCKYPYCVCLHSNPPCVSVTGTTVSVSLNPITDTICQYINKLNGITGITWAIVLKAYHTYLGASKEPVEYMPVTWNSVLALYYYYLKDNFNGNTKSGCSF